MRSRFPGRARALREPFGTAGLLVAIIALVFGMTGGAFAAKYIITSTKQIKPSVLKQLKGNVGPQGEKGAPGANGTNGTKGDQGIAGTSAGLPVAEATASIGPGGFGGEVALVGTTLFVPEPGKSYLLLAELRGNPIDADGFNEGTGPPGCEAFVKILINGEPAGDGNLLAGSPLRITANANFPPPHPVATSSGAVALQQAGVPQTISAVASSWDCGAGTTGKLRIVVIELG